MSTMTSLFRIHNNKTAELTELLFTPCFNYFCNKTEELYQQSIKLEGKEDKYYGLYIGNTYFYRPKSKLQDLSTYMKWVRIDESLQSKGQELEDFLIKVRQDVRFIQMWLSLVIDPVDPITTRAKLPTLLAKLHPVYKNTAFTEAIIPKGKELLWKQAEDKISFYIGLRMIL